MNFGYIKIKSRIIYFTCWTYRNSAVNVASLIIFYQFHTKHFDWKLYTVIIVCKARNQPTKCYRSLVEGFPCFRFWLQTVICCMLFALTYLFCTVLSNSAAIKNTTVHHRRSRFSARVQILLANHQDRLKVIARLGRPEPRSASPKAEASVRRKWNWTYSAW